MLVSHCQWFKKTKPQSLGGAEARTPVCRLVVKSLAHERADRHWLTTSSRWVFSRAAATRSLSASCLFTACSEAWVPGVMCTSILKRWGRDRRSLTLIDRPISVAMLQCGMVGVKATATVLSGSLTWVDKGDWKDQTTAPSTETLSLVYWFGQVT